jgi:hypothetical protein
MPISDLTQEQLEIYAKESTNWIELMTKCGYTNYGCRFYLKQNLDKYNISISHFIKKKGIKHYSHEEIFKENSEYRSMSCIKKKLIETYGWKRECSSCKFAVWLGQPIPLEIDHINGIHSDNRIDNLRFLCPTCHALTDTYKGKNIKNKEHSKHIYEAIKEREVCKNCNNKKYRNAEYCKECHLELKFKKKSNSTKKKEYHRKLKKCISCDKQIQLDCERCKDCYKKARKEKGIFEKTEMPTNINNKKQCPDCNKLIAKTSLRCRLCNYKVLKSKSEVEGKEIIKKQCVDCSAKIVPGAIRCLPCSNKIIEKANAKFKKQCIDCKKDIWNDATRCVECYRVNSRKVTRPTHEQLLTDKQSMSMVEIGKKYGVSDNAIRKWIKSYEKLMPT